MNVLESERPITAYEDAKIDGGNSPHENHPPALLPMIFTRVFYFKLELDSSGEWMLYKKARWEEDWLKITANAGEAAEYRFRHPFPLPCGELVPSYFRLKLDSSSKWVLYKKAHWEDDWLEITAGVVAVADASGASDFRQCWSKGEEAR